MKTHTVLLLIIIIVILMVMAYDYGLDHGRATAHKTQSIEVADLRLRPKPEPKLEPKPPQPESYRISVKVTAYCPCGICCGSNADGVTATGRDAALPGVAVDPDVIPMGSRVDIPGYPRGPNNNGSWILVDDTGSAVEGAHIDVRFRSHTEALRWASKHGPKLTIRVWPRRR